jgi:hypothetical protein
LRKTWFSDPLRWTLSIMDAQATGSAHFELHSKFVTLDVPEDRQASQEAS